MQPARVGWSDGLSPEVEAAVPRVIEAVLNELK
jgi:Ni,Fe-hydrogenase maturation factor